jgi:hypothetical protein
VTLRFETSRPWWVVYDPCPAHEGDRWLARLDRANTLPGQLVIDRRTGAMRAEETARRR